MSIKSTLLKIALAALLACCISACNQSKNKSKAGSHDFPIIDWSMLTPPKWDAMSSLKGTDLSKLQDSDPKAVELLKNVREQWNNAPVVKSWDGHAVSIKGYIAPLDGDATHIKEFLLVPYFGACIHSPPPPSNQIIHVRIKGLAIPFTNWDSFVTVSGVLQVKASSTGLGDAGYQMQAETLQVIN